MKLFDLTGKIALGSRLRLLTSKVTEDAAKMYTLYDMDFSPKWFPVYFVLAQDGEKTITKIAEEIGHSQPSVTKIVNEMEKAGLVIKELAAKDKRTNVVGLTEKGMEISAKIKDQYVDVDAAIQEIIDEATHNLWEAIGEWEFLLDQKSLFKRVMDHKKAREIQEVTVIDYTAEYQEVFKALNQEWISKYFEMEEADFKALDNPQEYIIDRGGRILVALYRQQAVGVCALIKMDNGMYDFEMAKMAVSPEAQGKNIGLLLGQSIIQTARNMGASKLYLESNTVLKPAISLYYKLGFQKVAGLGTPYKRCNIQMELDLKNK